MCGELLVDLMFDQLLYCTITTSTALTIRVVAHLGNSQMQWVIPPIGVHLLSQQSVGLHHDQGVASLHAEQEVVVVQVAADVGKLKGAFHHAAWGVSIVAEDAS